VNNRWDFQSCCCNSTSSDHMLQRTDVRIALIFSAIVKPS
jgi:hypothetical protein